MSRWNGIVLVTLVGLSASCDPRRFDELSDKTWVKIIEKPDSLKSKVFGTAAAGVATSGDGAQIVIAGSAKPSLLRVSVAPGGALSNTPFTATPLGLDETDVPMALLVDAEGNVYMGIDDGATQKGSVLRYDANISGSRDMLAAVTVPSMGNLGRGLALMNASLPSPIPVDAGSTDAIPVDAGSTDASPLDASVVDAGPTPDARPQLADASTVPDAATQREPTLVVLGKRAVVLVPVESNSPTPVRQCQTAIDISSMAVAYLSELAQDVIVLGLPGGSNASVRVLRASDVQGGQCPLGISLTNAEAGATLGTSVTVYDHDGDGAADVVASAPGVKKVYVFHKLSTTNPSVVIPPDNGAGADFGSTLAVGNFDDDTAEELVIGDPTATVGGQVKAGRALLIDGNRTLLLHSVVPEEDARFGNLLAVAPFRQGTTSHDLLLVGTANHVLLYFRVDASSSDPRQD